jgi:hypothetical protein
VVVPGMTCRSKDFAVEKTITGQLGGLVIGSGLHWSGTVRVKPSLDPVSCVTGVALLARRAHARAPRPFAKQHGTAAAQRAPVRGSTWNGSDGAVHDQGRWQANAQYDGAGKRRRQQQNRAGTRQGRWVVACTGSGYSGESSGRAESARGSRAPLSAATNTRSLDRGPRRSATHHTTIAARSAGSHSGLRLRSQLHRPGGPPDPSIGSPVFISSGRRSSNPRLA